MGFIVYNATSRLISSASRTQAEANTLAAADTDLTADTVDRALPNLFTPGGWFLTEAGEIVSQLPLSELEDVRATLWTTHGQLITWSGILVVEAITHSAAEAAIGHNILAYGHGGLYRIAERTDLTLAEKKVIFQQAAIGASDVTNAAQFFERVHSIANAVLVGPLSWVNPSTGVRIPFSDIPGSHTEYFNTIEMPISVNMSGGLWIDRWTGTVIPDSPQAPVSND